MREILFRGKRKDNGEWVYGGFALFKKKTYIVEVFEHHVDMRDWENNYTKIKSKLIEIIPETLGQFTGLLDKNGKKIFEGDILQNEKGDQITCVFEVKDGISLFNLFDEKNPKRMYFCIDEYFEIIGNIHEVKE